MKIVRKCISVEDFHARFSEWMDWVKQGGEILMYESDSTLIAHVVPEQAHRLRSVDWKTSAAFCMDQSDMRMLTAEESASILNNL